MTDRDGVDTGGRKRRPKRRPRPASGADPGGPSAGRGRASEPPEGVSELPPEPSPGPSDGPPAGRPRGRGRPTGAPGQGQAPRQAPRQVPRRVLGRVPTNGAPRFAKPLTAGAVLGWTALSAIAPGAAHLRAGRRRTGLALLSAYAVLLIAALAYGLTRSTEDLSVFAGDNMMVTIVVVAALGALCWFALLVSSYVVLNPSRLNQQGQIVSGILVGVLCVAMMAPFALTANAVLTIRGTIKHIFPSTPTDPGIAPIKKEDPWNGKDRVNFLLVGGDAAGNRTGVRTDSMNVASVHIPTGNTVLFSLPRNLQHVRFPPSSPLSKQFPNGFMAELPNGGLLNEVWQYANDHPEVMGGRNRGPRALMDAIGYTLGLRIDYYALMNMYGFADLVDAIGGLRVRVEQDVKWGGLYGTAGTIKAGYQRLSGEEALWYGRSRVGSDDFSRMGRQRCVIGAFAKQATPDKILLNFSKIAGATKRLAQTNIPEPLVQPLVALAVKVKGAKITSMQFVPPDFWPGAPDWVKIRRASAKAVQDSMKPARRIAAAGASPGATPGAASGAPSVSPSATPTASRAATPTETPTRNTQRAAAKSLDELCGF